MAPKKIVISTVGVLPHGLPRRFTPSPNANMATYHLVNDIPSMCSDTLEIMRSSQRTSRYVRLEVEAELLSRKSSFGFFYDHEIRSTAVTSVKKNVDDVVEDDFIPFGEDDNLPKSMRKKYDDMDADMSMYVRNAKRYASVKRYFMTMFEDGNDMMA